MSLPGKNGCIGPGGFQPGSDGVGCVANDPDRSRRQRQCVQHHCHHRAIAAQEHAAGPARVQCHPCIAMGRRGEQSLCHRHPDNRDTRAEGQAVSEGEGSAQARKAPRADRNGDDVDLRPVPGEQARDQFG